MKKQGVGLVYGKIPELDRRIINNYENAPSPNQRYITITRSGGQRTFSNLAKARVDVVKNLTKRVVLGVGSGM